MIRVLGQPANYNFDNTIDPAQGSSSVNPDKYLFWDDVHPTTAGHFQLATAAFDTITLPSPTFSKTVNIATRVFVGVGDEVSIAGFMIKGPDPKQILIRGIGPSLTSQGVPTVLADPTLSLFDQGGTLLQSNDNWQDTQGPAITATGIAPQDPMESAMVPINSWIRQSDRLSNSVSITIFWTRIKSDLAFHNSI